jgi:hypothetical protein
MSCASLPDTDCASRQRFYVWPAMLGDSLSIVKELTPSGRARIQRGYSEHTGICKLSG